MHRRTFLRVAAAPGVGAAAGCSLGGDAGREGYGNWFEDVDDYDGTADRTGRDRVRVLVGAEGTNGPFAFEPTAVRVDAGTEVVWEWTGEGGEHNVVERRGRFRSEFASSAGHTYARRFEDPGTFLYYCDPHKSLGMKGALRVE